jgi:hypothetical protein
MQSLRIELRYRVRLSRWPSISVGAKVSIANKEGVQVRDIQSGSQSRIDDFPWYTKL